MKYKGNNNQEFETVEIEDKTFKGVIRKIDFNIPSWVFTLIVSMRLGNWADVTWGNDHTGIIWAWICILSMAYIYKMITGLLLLFTSITDELDVEDMARGVFFDSYDIPLFRIIIISNGLSVMFTNVLLHTHLHNLVMFVFDKVG
jgi:hypothetical protein